ncbi:MAG TPA: MFS transporter [Desulfatiglandales bacterium]|nr:MFS transporter [Desulfatiglandales bacterium]
MISQKANETRRRKKTLFSVVLLISLLLGLSGYSHASWWINPKKFHASVHGQTPCQNCHEDIGKQGLHPNPEEIAKGSQDRFQPDHCLVCHEEVMSDLEKGKHGSQQVQDPERHKLCLACHDPHEQAPIKEKVKFDPGKPRHEQCGACHEEKKELPPLSAEDEACMACHRLVQPEDSKAAEKLESICFHCHAQLGTPAQTLTGKKIALVDPTEYGKTPHAKVACVTCHPLATETGHGKDIHGDCRQCHLPYHDEKVAHDLHGLVACGSCHLQGTQPLRDPKSKHVVWKRNFTPGQSSRVHQMVVRDDEVSCRHCHSSSNQVGAASMVLPAKSIICMPCHAGTFSAGDTTTLITLILFLAGLVMVFSYVLTGGSSFFSLVGGAVGALFSKKIGAILEALFLDVLLQRRLYRQSPKRWLIHGLIFYAFAFRFVWGILALLGSLWLPEKAWVWPMLDKNSSLTAFLFDLSGVMIILGALFAYFRGRQQRSERIPDLPRQDVVALSLIAAIVIVGFVLEGMWIAMTGFPEGSCYAFLGYAIGRLFFSASPLVNVYGYIWYLHAILTGAFIAYVPFSKLLHIIISPFVLMGTATRRHEHGRE